MRMEVINLHPGFRRRQTHYTSLPEAAYMNTPRRSQAFGSVRQWEFCAGLSPACHLSVLVSFRPTADGSGPNRSSDAHRANFGGAVFGYIGRRLTAH